MELSFIIVNYNVTELLRNCLLSIQKYATDIPHEMIVVDNNSTDQSWRQLENEFKDVRFIASDKNVGFAKANNRAVDLANGEWIYILNPDTELQGFYLQELLYFARNTDRFGSLGLRMHDAHGNFLPESKRSVPDVFNSFEKLFLGTKKKGRKTYYRDDIPENEIAEVEILTGANLLMKKSVYQRAGGFDEAYFMYGEDIDLCYTLLQQGFRNFYYGKYPLLHHKGESTIKDEKYLRNFYGAMDIFVNKYYRNKPAQRAILRSGLWLKCQLEKRKLK